MTADEVIDLLTIAAAYDRRKIGESDVLAWGEASKRARWTFDEAREAIHEHYAASTEWLMPAHITAAIKHARDIRSHPPRFDRAALEATPAASEERRRQVMALVSQLAAKKGIPR